MRTASLMLAAFALMGVCGGAEWHVKTTGTAGGSGAEASPWDLQTALNQPASVKPGDTIWVHAGTYTGPFTSNINGTAAAPVVVRAAAGERATVKGAITYYGSHVWFWGLDVIGNNECFAAGLKLINDIVHDTRAGSGIDFWKGVIDGEINGCLEYNCGFDGPDRGHGHGIYTQNKDGTKHIIDNIIYNQYGWGIHCYTQGGNIDNYDIQGNTVFNNGGASKTTNAFTQNIIVIGKTPKNYTYIGNMTYFNPDIHPGSGNNQLNIADGLTMKDNYFACGGQSLVANPTKNDARTGNTFIGPVSGFTAAQFPENTYVASYTTLKEAKTFVRPNKYEKGRANVTVYNWGLKDSVKVDLSGTGLAAGDAFEVRDALNFFGKPVVEGSYKGAEVEVPMKGLTIAAPEPSLGIAPVHTAPRFGVFVVLKKK
jgi:hypothetical protein